MGGAKIHLKIYFEKCVYWSQQHNVWEKKWSKSGTFYFIFSLRVFWCHKESSMVGIHSNVEKQAKRMLDIAVETTGGSNPSKGEMNHNSWLKTETLFVKFRSERENWQCMCVGVWTVQKQCRCIDSTQDIKMWARLNEEISSNIFVNWSQNNYHDPAVGPESLTLFLSALCGKRGIFTHFPLLFCPLSFCIITVLILL